MPESTDNDGGPALDVEALFASLQDGIRREELVAQQRPNGAILAETMRNFIDITYSTFETNRVEQERMLATTRVSTTTGWPHPGPPQRRNGL